MKRFLVNMALGLLLGLTLQGSALAGPPPRSATEDQASQQILVLLRISADHVRPGGDYGGAYDDQVGRAARRRIAARLAQRYGLRLVDGWPMPLLGLDCFIMEAGPGRSTNELTAKLALEAEVAAVEPNHAFHGRGGALVHTDPLYLAQPAALRWRLADLHQLATGRGVEVAIIDSMVDENHPDLRGQVEVSENFVSGRPAKPEDHGTGVAGIIAARADNNVGIVGVAPHARLMALRACWQLNSGRNAAEDTVCDTLSLAKALHFAIDHHAAVINMSLSGPSDFLLGKLIDIAVARDIKVVAAYDRQAADGGFPASHAGVIAVIDEAIGPVPAGVYSAPGRGVPTTQPGGRWFVVDGSSYAAAHVSGLMALVKERHSDPRMALVAAKFDGQIDACASLLRASDRHDSACALQSDPVRGAR